MVIGVSDPEDAFLLTQKAHDFAEKYRIPVIILSEKAIAETFKTINPKDLTLIPIERHLTDPKTIEPKDYFGVTDSGVSPRWLPTSDKEKYFFANGDEHDGQGRLDESEATGEMYQKRIRKLETLKKELPDPKIYGKKSAEISFIGWGSSRNIMRDVIAEAEKQGISVNYLHYEYLWPLKTDVFLEFAKANPNLNLIEGNATGQLGNTIKAETGFQKFSGKFLKWNGRPFFVEEVLEYIKNKS